MEIEDIDDESLVKAINEISKKKNPGDFKFGNQLARKYSANDVIECFNQVLEKAETDKKCFTLEYAILNSDIPKSTYYSYLKKFPKELKPFWEQSTAHIINRNFSEGASGNINATIAIAGVNRFDRYTQETDLSLKGTANIIISKDKAKEISDMLEGDC